MQIKEHSAKIDVVPPWFDPAPIPKLEQIRTPPTYDLKSPADKQQIDVISTYRSINQKSLDFVQQPFLAKAEDTETLVVVLNQVVDQFGIGLSFTNSQFSYEDSFYRAACGVIDLGNIHSLFTAESDIETANFRFNFDDRVNYTDISRTAKTLKEFILEFIVAIAEVLGCRPEYIRVFSLSNNAEQERELGVSFGITTPSERDTRKLAERLKSVAVSGQFQQQVNHSILQHVKSGRYEFRLEPTIKHLQLQMSDLEPKYNRDFKPGHYTTEEERGGRKYYLPMGWFRHALKVEDKYPEDKRWLGMSNHPDEWSVAYHGTESKVVKGIARDGFSSSKMKRDIMRKEAIAQVGAKADVPGIYLATHCDKGAADYTSPFSVKNTDGKTVQYRIVFQCRVQQKKYTEHGGHVVAIGKALRVFDEKAVRPYGLLLREDSQLQQPQAPWCCIA